METWLQQGSTTAFPLPLGYGRARKRALNVKKLVGDNHGLKKSTGKPGRSIKWPELDTMLPLWIDRQRKDHKKVTLKAIRKQALLILGDLGVNATPEDIPKSWIFRMCRRNGFSQRRKSTANQHDPDDLIPKYQRTVLYFKNLMNKNNYSLGNIKAMDETSYFSDNMGSVTLTRKGSKEVVLKNTGNEKKMQTLVLSINCDGTID